MLAGARKVYYDAFVLDEGKLRKFSSVLDTFAARLDVPTAVQYRVTREDNSFYDTGDIDVVVSDDNAAGRAVRRLTLSLRTVDDEALQTVSNDRPLAMVTFGARREDGFDEEPEISFTVIERERDWCFLLADELDTQIKRLTRRRLGKRPLKVIDSIVPLMLVLGTFLFTYRSLHLQPLTPAEIAAMSLDARTRVMLQMLVEREGKISSYLPLFAGMFLFIPLTIFKPVSSIVRKFYQPVFYWGDVVASHDRRIRTITNLKWGVVMAFVVSILASFAYARLAR